MNKKPIKKEVAKSEVLMLPKGTEVAYMTNMDELLKFKKSAMALLAEANKQITTHKAFLKSELEKS